MSHTFDRHKIRLPRDKDRRIKLTDAERAHIRTLYDAGTKIREIARLYEGKCSRTLIQFVIFPERYEERKRQFRLRRKDGRYYDKEDHRLAIKKTRAWKYSLKLMLPKSALKPWTWYSGQGRNANIALWDGSNFHTVGQFYSVARLYCEGHYSEGGTFKPFRTLRGKP